MRLKFYDFILTFLAFNLPWIVLFCFLLNRLPTIIAYDF